MEKREDNIIIIKSGNNNKSIYAYLNKVCLCLKNSSSKVHLKAYENNMNKLVTLVEILKRNLNQLIKVEYKIGLEEEKNFIECYLEIILKSEKVNKMLDEIMNYNKENKRKNIPENMMKIEEKKEEKEEGKNIEDLCFENINEFFPDL